MTDKDLLEAAAKAAGLFNEWPSPGYGIQFSDSGAWCYGEGKGKGVLWNPLIDGGDALRLFCALPWMVIETSDIGVTVRERSNTGTQVYLMCMEWIEDHRGDINAATRRAIVRAAAAIGAAK